MSILYNKTYAFEIKKQVMKFGVPDGNIILEPEGKNTAPAIGFFAELIYKKDRDALFVTLPSDHYIANNVYFRNSLRKGIRVAEDKCLVTFGIRPKKPSTGYGYIKVHPRPRMTGQNVTYYTVERFLEKPTSNKAKQYYASQQYFWNSGIFIWRADVFLSELKRFLPRLFSQLQAIGAKGMQEHAWKKIRPISVDYGILEHSKENRAS